MIICCTVIFFLYKLKVNTTSKTVATNNRYNRNNNNNRMWFWNTMNQWIKSPGQGRQTGGSLFWGMGVCNYIILICYVAVWGKLVQYSNIKAWLTVPTLYHLSCWGTWYIPAFLQWDIACPLAIEFQGWLGPNKPHNVAVFGGKCAGLTRNWNLDVRLTVPTFCWLSYWGHLIKAPLQSSPLTATHSQTFAQCLL